MGGLLLLRQDALPDVLCPAIGASVEHLLRLVSTVVADCGYVIIVAGPAVTGRSVAKMWAATHVISFGWVQGSYTVPPRGILRARRDSDPRIRLNRPVLDQLSYLPVSERVLPTGQFDTTVRYADSFPYTGVLPMNSQSAISSGLIACFSSTAV